MPRKLDEPYINYGRNIEGNPYLLERPKIVTGPWHTPAVIVSEIVVRLFIGLVVAALVFRVMMEDYDPSHLHPTELEWRLYPFIAGALASLFPNLMFFY